MAWTKLCDRFHDNDKVLSFSHEEFRLYVCALTRSAQHGTGGFVSDAAVAALCRQQQVHCRVIAGLVEKRAFEPAAGGWTIHDYDKYLPGGSHAKSEAGRKGGVQSGISRRSTRSKTELEAQQSAPSTGRPVPVPQPVPQPVPVPVSGDSPHELPPLGVPPAREAVTELIAPGQEWVAEYVRTCRSLGVEPVESFKGRVGKEAKALAGKSPDLIRAAISRAVERNRPPNALPYLVADIERERAGHALSTTTIRENPIDQRIRVTYANAMSGTGG